MTVTKKAKRVTKKKETPKLESKKLSEPDDLHIYIGEAQQVELMTHSEGWLIIERDLNDYREKIGSRLAYINPESEKYDEARIQYIASDKLIKMVEDYAENKRRAMELLERLENPQSIIPLDVDNG